MMTLSAVHKNRADPCRLISQQRCLDQMWQFKCANCHSYHASRACRYQNHHQTSGPQYGEPSIFESIYPETNTHLEFVTMTTRLVESETPTHWPEGLVYPVTLLRRNLGNLLMHVAIGCCPECMSVWKRRNAV